MATTVTAWTKEDLAMYCEYCMVIALDNVSEKYCVDCANDVVEYLAVRFDEQGKVDRGLY